jgi:putative SOS response-associated peptidase YedK
MCYFVEINLPRKELEKRFGLPMKKDPRYMPGIFFSAFTNPFLPVIKSSSPEMISTSQWGLIPFWIKDEEAAEKIRRSTYNARGETIWEKPSFRSAVVKGRCLVLAHGFFEYHTTCVNKIPFFIRRKDNRPFAFAGIAECWTNPSTGEIVDSFSIITTAANPLMAKIHNTKQRMPLILPENHERDWINPLLDRKELEELIQPSPEKEFEAWPVTKSIIKAPPFSTDVKLLEKCNYDELTF